MIDPAMQERHSTAFMWDDTILPHQERLVPWMDLTPAERASVERFRWRVEQKSLERLLAVGKRIDAIYAHAAEQTGTAVVFVLMYLGLLGIAGVGAYWMAKAVVGVLK